MLSVRGSVGDYLPNWITVHVSPRLDGAPVAGVASYLLFGENAFVACVPLPALPTLLDGQGMIRLSASVDYCCDHITGIDRATLCVEATIPDQTPRDLRDLADLQTCFSGIDGDPIPAGCAEFDYDAQGDVDLDDFRALQFSLVGPA